jgi:hypothetical protein
MKYIARDMVDILLYESSNTKFRTRKGIYHTQAYRRGKIRDRKKLVRVFGIFAQQKNLKIVKKNFLCKISEIFVDEGRTLMCLILRGDSLGHPPPPAMPM